MKIRLQIITVISLIIFIGCSHKSGIGLELMPGVFIDRDISLDDIADDLVYIPLSNELPVYRSTSIKWYNNCFYYCDEAKRILRFDNDGKYIDALDNQGRGAEEYQLIVDFSVDSLNGNIYINSGIDKIIVYDNKLRYLRSIKYPIKRAGPVYTRMLNSQIHFFYFNIDGHGYNWVLTDTLGNIISNKKSVDTYKLPIRMSEIQIFSNNTNLYRYFNHNDTIYEINKSGYKPYRLINRNFKDGYDLIDNPAEYNTRESENPYRVVRSIFGLGDYWLINYIKIMHSERNPRQEETVLYDFNNNLSYLVNSATAHKDKLTQIGLYNDWIGAGTIFPNNVLKINDYLYLLSVKDASRLLQESKTNDFINGIPRRPEIRKRFQELTDTLQLEDNPVLILLKLK